MNKDRTKELNKIVDVKNYLWDKYFEHTDNLDSLETMQKVLLSKASKKGAKPQKFFDKGVAIAKQIEFEKEEIAKIQAKMNEMDTKDKVLLSPAKKDATK